MAVMVARGDLDLEVALESDTAALHGLAESLLDAARGVRCMRDPTRGGLATTLNELALAAGVSIAISESAVPVRPEVTGACEILGLDPLYVASEGRLVAVVAAEDADAALSALQAHPLGVSAALVGEVRADPPGLVLLETAFGGTRVVDMLAGDPLPRIC
jgi:hydrogenase expression/formation protein HypE